MLFKIADIGIELQFDCAKLAELFKSFKVTQTNVDLSYSLLIGTPTAQNDCEWVDTPECKIALYNFGYDCFLKDEQYVNSLSLRENGQNLKATIYINSYDEQSEEFIDEIFDVMKFAFYTALQNQNKIAVHSCSIVYRDRAILFAANSGVGKSTHAQYWQECFGIDIFNGDVTVIGFEDDTPTCYAIPWCGSSNMYMTANCQLGAICFLQRGEKNSFVLLNYFDSVLATAKFCFTNNLTPQGIDHNVSLAEQICKVIPSCRILVQNDKSAAIYAKKQIDYLLSEHL